MKSRGIVAGLCICMVIGLSGCGKKAPDASDFAVGRTQEEARAETRRHMEQDNAGTTDKESAEAEKGRGNSEAGEENRKKDGQQAEEGAGNEKRSETARAALEEELRRRESAAGQHENGDSSSRRYEGGNSSSGRRRGDGSFQVDCISFMLPEGWEKDEYLSDDYDTYFTPDGDTDSAMDCLIISQVSEAFGMIDMFLENMDEMESILAGEIAEEEEEYHITVDDIGMTFLGHTIKMEAFVRDESGAGVIVLYFAEDDSNLYSLYAYTMFDEDEDVDAETGCLSVQMEEALRMFFETGQVENRKL